MDPLGSLLVSPYMEFIRSLSNLIRLGLTMMFSDTFRQLFVVMEVAEMDSDALREPCEISREGSWARGPNGRTCRYTGLAENQAPQCRPQIAGLCLYQDTH